MTPYLNGLNIDEIKIQLRMYYKNLKILKVLNHE
jgi:hypothetical protein